MGNEINFFYKKVLEKFFLTLSNFTLRLNHKNLDNIIEENVEAEWKQVL